MHALLNSQIFIYEMKEWQGNAKEYFAKTPGISRVYCTGPWYNGIPYNTRDSELFELLYDTRMLLLADLRLKKMKKQRKATLLKLCILFGIYVKGQFHYIHENSFSFFEHNLRRFRSLLEA